MKKITTILAAVLMTISLSSFANSSANPLREKNAKDILLTYVEATALGTSDFNNYLFTKDFQYENLANKDKFGKRKYVKFLDSNKGLNYNCNKSYEVLDVAGKTAIAKSTLVFENFTRVDHITLTQTKDGWKISKVVTSYM
jgi:hypothetical protein